MGQEFVETCFRNDKRMLEQRKFTAGSSLPFQTVRHLVNPLFASRNVLVGECKISEFFFKIWHGTMLAHQMRGRVSDGCMKLGDAAVSSGRGADLQIGSRHVLSRCGFARRVASQQCSALPTTAVRDASATSLRPTRCLATCESQR